MDDTTRPNIITVGIFMGALVQIVVWAWNGWSSFDLGPGESAALTTILTAIAQFLDRSSKRANEHVLTKYGNG